MKSLSLVVAVISGALTLAHSQSWMTVNSPTSGPLRTIDFVDSLHGWMAEAYSPEARIWRTTDGGESWLRSDSGVTDYIHHVTFFDTLNGWAVGEHDGSYGLAFRTSDGGNHWIRRDTGTFSVLKGATFTDPDRGWVCGSFSYIDFTTDGGDTWVTQECNGHGADFYDISHIGFDSCWVVGRFGEILFTTDAGTSWTEQVSGVPQRDLTAIEMIDGYVGWIVGTGSSSFPTILHTTDAGTTWTPQLSSPVASLTDLAYWDADRAWVVGLGGVIRHTADGGETWIADSSGTVQSLYAISLLSPTNAWAVGDGGALLHYAVATNARGQDSQFPFEYGLSAYPNPFNPSTTVQFDLATTGRAQVSVYDLTGRLVEILEDRVLSWGTHTLILDGSRFASGMYFVRLKSGQSAATRKVVLVR